MGMRVDTAWHHHLAACVNLACARRQIDADRRDLLAHNSDVGTNDGLLGYDGTSAYYQVVVLHLGPIGAARAPRLNLEAAGDRAQLSVRMAAAC